MPATEVRRLRPVTERRRVSELVLDEFNYRFAETPPDKRQQALLALLLEDHQLNVVGESLAENGYFEQEPLVTIDPPADGMYTVVEGNRRLAALRLLTEAEARASIPPSKKVLWDRLSAEAARRGNDFSDVPIVRYPGREAVRAFLGNRHIAGIKKWDALSKARFVAELVESKGATVEFGVIANEIGSDRDTVRQTYLAYRAFIQARDLFKIDTSGVSRSFSVFFRSFQYVGIREFVGGEGTFAARDRAEALADIRDPIPADHRDRLTELVGYIHGEGKSKKVLPESRDLKKLSDVLSNSTALKVLRESRDLGLALEFVSGEGTRLLRSLRSAATHLEEARSETKRRIDDGEIEQAVLRCVRAADALLAMFPDAKRKLETGG